MTSLKTRTTRLRKLEYVRLICALTLAVALAACSDSPAPTGPDATELLPGLTVSDVQPGPAGGGLSAASPGVAYISASPGTFSDAVSITITNLDNGASETIDAQENGFDPIILEAEPGDEIEIVVHHSDGSTTSYKTFVPVRKRPRVVRTVPPRSATDVVLSVSVFVIFSEPVDGTTITAGTFQLQFDDEPVDGTIDLDEEGLISSFKPMDLLREGSAYKVLVTTGVADLAGDTLEEQFETTFRTGSSIGIYLCAKQPVVEEINGIDEPWPEDDPSWSGPIVNSTDPDCGVWSSEYSPHGIFRYKTEGPRFEWEFEGEGFVPTVLYYVDDNWTVFVRHRYRVIIYPDPWPGLNLVCLGEGRPSVSPEGVLSLSGSSDLHGDLTNAKIWIVGSSMEGGADDVVDFVDCTGRGASYYWTNGYGVPRLTNDRTNNGVTDATKSGHHCWGRPLWCMWPEFTFYYDWLFETALVNYHDTG